VGLSPHAPYSAGVDAYTALAREADARGWPVTSHLHETRSEIELYVKGRGEFRRWPLTGIELLLGRFRPSGKSPIRTLADAGFFARPVLAAHGNYLDDKDIEILRRSRSTVIYCPRSHDYFGHERHPYPRLLASGAAVALGTDSLASSPSLSILAEMRFLHRLDPDLPGDILLTMATAAGADALGRGGRAGRLVEGEDADLVALTPTDGADGDPYELLLEGAAHSARVWIRGEEIRPAS